MPMDKAAFICLRASADGRSPVAPKHMRHVCTHPAGGRTPVPRRVAPRPVCVRGPCNRRSTRDSRCPTSSFLCRRLQRNETHEEQRESRVDLLLHGPRAQTGRERYASRNGSSPAGRSVYTRDAYAWALQANGRHAEARKQMKAALSIGTRDPQLLKERAKAAQLSDQRAVGWLHVCLNDTLLSR